MLKQLKDGKLTRTHKRQVQQIACNTIDTQNTLRSIKIAIMLNVLILNNDDLIGVLYVENGK